MLQPLFTIMLGFEFTSPGPSIFQIGPLNLRWYGLLIASAVLVGLFLAQRLARTRQLNPELIGDLAVWLILGAIPVARLYYVLFQWDYYSKKPQEILAIWQGGIAIHGAILGGMLAAFLFSRIKHCSFWRLADVVAPALILGQAIGRWGNFFNSEAFGSPTDLPWKLLIPLERRPFGMKDIEYYHPTFLYESLWDLMVFGVLMMLWVRFPKAKRGTIFLVYAISYSLGRLWIEALRTDSLMIGPLKIAQLVSLIGIGLGSLGLLWLYLVKRPLPDVSTASKQPPLGY